MADAPEASAPPTEAVANLHLDEVTGERVSKSEIKKRQKNRQKEEERLKKAAAAPPKPAAVKKSNAEADEKELNPNVYFSSSLHLFPARVSRRAY
jgi:lysyl-tRNA synthetase class 2